MMSTKQDDTFPNFSETYHQLKLASHFNRQGDPARDLNQERTNTTAFEGQLPNNTFMKLFNK